jgi:hypothetical protein
VGEGRSVYALFPCHTPGCVSWLVVGGWWTKICLASGVIRRLEGDTGERREGTAGVCNTSALLCCKIQNVPTLSTCIIIAVGCPRVWQGYIPCLAYLFSAVNVRLVPTKDR